MIRDLAFDTQGQLRSGWVEGHHGQGAITWISKDLVVQRRSGNYFEGWKTANDILSEIEDPRKLLIASKNQYEEDEGYFWTSFSRFDLEGSPASYNPKSLSSDQVRKMFSDSLDEVVETSLLLRSCPVQSELIRINPSKSTAAKFCGDRTLAGLVKAIHGIEISAPKLPESNFVLCHGDPLLKNIILTEYGFRLIDWENFSIHPEYSDAAHGTAWALMRQDDKIWPSFLEEFMPKIELWMNLHEDEVRTVLFWSVIKEAIFWKQKNDFDPVYQAAKSHLI